MNGCMWELLAPRTCAPLTPQTPLPLSPAPAGVHCRDIVFIDALHENRFAMWYTKELLPGLQSGTRVMVHDM